MKHPRLRTTLRMIGGIVLVPFLLWVLGLWIYRPVSLLPAALLGMVWLALFRSRRIERRSALNQMWLWALACCMVVTYFALPGPSNVTWQKPWARDALPVLDGDVLTITNLRDFRYRTEEDYDMHYRSERYDLRNVTGASFVESHWDGMEAICHTMLSFDFSDGRHLVISPETRLPQGVKQNDVGGLYKLYNLLYVFGSEEDILALRTNYRHEDLLLLPLNVSPEQARAMLLQLVAEARQAEEEHQPYNTVTANCSTGILGAMLRAGIRLPRGYQLLPVHNGSISKVLYDNGLLRARPGESYNAMRKRCYLRYDLAKGNPGDYSRAIREKIQASEDGSANADR